MGLEIWGIDVQRNFEKRRKRKGKGSGLAGLDICVEGEIRIDFVANETPPAK